MHPFQPSILSWRKKSGKKQNHFHIFGLSGFSQFPCCPLYSICPPSLSFTNLYKFHIGGEVIGKNIFPNKPEKKKNAYIYK